MRLPYNWLGSRRFFRQLHRAFKLRFFRFETEVFRIEIVDLSHVVGSERRTFRRFGEFDELLFVVNVRQRRCDAIVGEQPLQRRLPKCALGIFQEAQFVDLL